jgi:hypothetical protein
MRQSCRPVPVRPTANVAAGDRDQMLHDRRPEHFQEKILVRFRFAPQLLRVFLAFPPGTDRNQHCAIRSGFDKLIVKLF